jgi:hypothetical protein
MANPVFGMMQSLDGYVDVIKAEVQGDIASFIEASPATYVPDDRSRHGGAQAGVPAAGGTPMLGKTCFRR